MAVRRLAALGVRAVGQLPIAGHATLVGSAHRARLLSASAGAPPPPPPRCGPLQDITVIDLTRVLAGPYCTLLLRELGARVIKVENPVGGDDSRHFGPWLPSGDSAYFETLNAGKESIGLDLKQPKDREALHALLARADVLIENFRPGVMDRMGLGWETLSQQYPRLCYTSISGFGQTGPDRLMSAYDCSVQALGGIMSVTGSASRPSEPIRVGISIGDIGAGIYAALGVTAALHHRAATGRGCQIDVSMLDCQVALLLHQYASHDVNGVEPTKLGSRHPTITPFQAYRAGKGKDEEHFVIGAGNNKLFGIVAEVLGHPEWTDDARFASNATRTQHCAELEVMMEEALKKRPAREWVGLLVSRGVPSALIHGIAQASVQPQIAARRMLVDHVCLGTDPDNTAPIAAAYPGAALTTTPEHTGAAHAPRKLLRTAGNPIKMPGILPDTVTRMRSPKLDEQGTLLRQEATEVVPPYAAEEARLQAQVARAVAQALRERPADAVARVAELLSAKE